MKCICHSNTACAVAVLNWLAEAIRDHSSPLCWTLHELKRKVISDSKNKCIGGRKTEAIRQRYNVKTFTAPN